MAHFSSAAAFRSISVADLRALLADHSDDAMVAFASDYGDHCRTQQVHPLSGVLEPAVLEVSAYSVSGVALVPFDRDPYEYDCDEDASEEELEEQPSPAVLVLR